MQTDHGVRFYKTQLSLPQTPETNPCTWLASERTQPRGGSMEQEEVAVEETIPENEGIEPFDWEDLLYESWL